MRNLFKEFINTSDQIFTAFRFVYNIVKHLNIERNVPSTAWNPAEYDPANYRIWTNFFHIR